MGSDNTCGYSSQYHVFLSQLTLIVTLIQQQLHKMQFRTFIIHLLQTMNCIKLAPDVLCTSKAICRTIMKYQYYYFSAVSNSHFFWQCYLQRLGYMNLEWLPRNWETLMQKEEFSVIYFRHLWDLEYTSTWFNTMGCPRSNTSNGWDHWFPLLVSTAPYSLWYFVGLRALPLPWITHLTCSAVYVSTYRLSFRISPLHMPASSPWEQRRFLSSVHLFFCF